MLFIQLYHLAWDHHSGLTKNIRAASLQTDQAREGLIQDLKERGLLDETLVIWAGEFGRTVYSQGKLTAEDYGRDHHPRAFTIWMAGGGIRPGVTVGATDDESTFVLAQLREAQAIHEEFVAATQSQEELLAEPGVPAVESGAPDLPEAASEATSLEEFRLESEPTDAAELRRRAGNG